MPISLAKRMLQGAGAAVGLTIFNLAIQRPPKASLWLILARKTSANVLSLLAYALFVFGALLAALAWSPAGA